MTDSTADLGQRSVMVTGATTPLGHGIVDRLISLGVGRVLAIGRGAQDGHLQSLQGVTYLKADLARSRDRRCLMYGPARDHVVDTIVDAAFHRSATASGRKAHALNVESTRELLALSERHPTINAYILRSFADVYDVRPRLPAVIDETHPLKLGGRDPQWLRDRVEMDLVVCTRMGMNAGLRIAVLRCAECLAPGMGSQLYDWLQTKACLRPMGFDPMVNLASIADLAAALARAALCSCQGIFNIPGADTLPLSRAAKAYGRRDLPLPEPWLLPLYALRHRTLGTDFRYDLNRNRFHFSGVMDGAKAEAELGYVPSNPIAWPAARPV